MLLSLTLLRMALNSKQNEKIKAERKIQKNEKPKKIQKNEKPKHKKPSFPK